LKHLRFYCARIKATQEAEKKLAKREERRQVCTDIMQELICLSVDLHACQTVSIIKSILIDIIRSLPDEETNPSKPVYNIVPCSVSIKRMTQADFELFSSTEESLPESRSRHGRRISPIKCNCCAHKIHVVDFPRYRYNNDAEWQPASSVLDGGTNSPNYICKICGKAYRRLGLLERHRLKEHPFQCKTCENKFATLEDFRNR
jgi:hypothetical protein